MAHSSSSLKLKLISACAGLLLFSAVARWWVVGRQSEVDISDSDHVGDSQPDELLFEYAPPSNDGYVGSESCRQCHAEISDSYAFHPMARSVTVAESLPSSSPATADIPGKARVYHVSLSDNRVTHHDRMYDSESQLIYDQPVKMEYVFGSGQRAFAYLHQQGDMLFQSPLNWYTQEAKWDLSPGYTLDDPRRFRRRITEDCVACHTGRANVAGRGLNRFEKPAFAELSIGCENCHGPGERHIVYHQNSSHAGSHIDPIVNPCASVL